MLSALSLFRNARALRELWLVCWRHRRLAYELARREVSERYSGQLFGALWTIGHPLLLILIYAFLFAFLFKTRTGGTLETPLDHTAYILAGLIPWLAFQESMSKACTVIINNANVVKQVIFPVEVLPLKGVLATLFSELVFVGLLALYSLVRFGHLTWMYLLLPLLVLLQVAGMIGVTYLLAAIAPYFPDTKDFIQVFNTVAFFLLPILYQPESLGNGVLRAVLYCNPFSYMVLCFQDVLYFGWFKHPYAWAVFASLDLAVLALGYRLFRHLKTMFGNVL